MQQVPGLYSLTWTEVQALDLDDLMQLVDSKTEMAEEQDRAAKRAAKGL
jgi:hypothetical protein